MKKLLILFIFLWAPMAVAYTYEELLDSIDDDEPMRVRTSLGIVREISLSERSIIIGGFEYVVGPSYAESPVEVSLYGTTAGSFELLSAGMKVKVIYIDFGVGRVAFDISEVDPTLDVEH